MQEFHHAEDKGGASTPWSTVKIVKKFVNLKKLTKNRYLERKKRKIRSITRITNMKSNSKKTILVLKIPIFLKFRPHINFVNCRGEWNVVANFRNRRFFRLQIFEKINNNARKDVK